MRTRVLFYEGYKGEETPRAFYVGERLLEVVEVLDRWRGEDHEYFKLAASDGGIYIIRRGRERGEWEITLFTRGTPLPPG
jgi:hypothetical protein